MAQWFGFADSGEGIAANGFDQFKNTECGFPIGGYPVSQIIEEIAVED
jgi:hypothetical protein